MKKFFTILWVFMGFVNLYAQTISPSAVLGDVYVAGPVYSKGAIYIKADNTGATGRRGAVEVATTGTFSADSIIFYSNRDRDGLLRNKGTVKGTGSPTPTYVAVRKYLTDNVPSEGWQHVSFPFTVPFTNIKSISGQTLTYKSNFWVYYYDIKKRAETGTTAGNWYEIDNAVNTILPKDTLRRGIGYNIWGKSTGDELDFITTNTTEIADLFNTTVDKTEVLAYYEGLHSIGGGPGFKTRYGSGWNLIGGLNSDNFVAHVISAASTVEFSATLESSGYPQTTTYTNGSIYYWANPGDNSVFLEYSLDPALVQDPLIMSPYVPFFVQTDTIVGPPHANVGRSIVFKGTGNFITYNALTPKRTRSLTSEDSEVRDIFSLSLTTTSGIENSSDQLFLMFGDMYHEEYVPVEDGIKMTTISSIPRVWSANEDNTALFMNRLPRKDQMREVNIGFSSPVTAEYTFKMTDVQNTTVRSAVLWDKLTNKRVDLLLDSYTFSATGSASEVKDRFVLFINGGATDLNNIAKSEVYAYATDNVLTIKNLLPGCNVQVSDLSGRTIVRGIATGDKFSTALNQKGVYIVNVKGEKNAVLKILNK